jgi:hypothetical protein
LEGDSNIVIVTTTPPRGSNNKIIMELLALLQYRPLAQEGWNATYPYNTRYRAPLQANLTSVQVFPLAANISSHLNIEDKFHTMVSSIEQMYTLINDSTYDFTYPSALHAHTEKDTLHYGKMVFAIDRVNFFEAMKKKADGLKDILEVVSRSSVSTSKNPYLSVGLQMEAAPRLVN